MLRMCEGLDRFSDFRSEISNLTGMAANVSKQLHGWIESLKNSNIKGVKFLTNEERSRINTVRERDEFDREMESFNSRHQDWLERRQADPDAKL